MKQRKLRYRKRRNLRRGIRLLRRADHYPMTLERVHQLERAGVQAPREMAQLYALALEQCPPNEESRWRQRLDAARAGRRIKVMNVEAEVYAGDDLVALERGRALLNNEEQFNAALPRG